MVSLKRNRSGLVLLGVVAIVAAVLFVGTMVSACNTPVYRYAMYNWRVSPYPIFYLYDGEEPEEDKKANKLIEELSMGEREIANVVLEKIDVSDPEKVKKLPGWEVIEKAWKSYDDGALPAHLVMTPWGGKVFAGRLDEKSVKALVESPARTRLGELLEEGNAAVMIFLPGEDKAENKRAEEALDELIARSNRNEIPVALDLSDPAMAGMTPPGESGEGEEAEDAEPKPPLLKIGKLKVDRSDPAELWFVRALMTIEPDLQEYVKEPMIFAGYGRGRAMEPYIGKGITPDNLVDVVAFLAGACSCMVKEQNPGADLLVKWDWESTADMMSANDPSLEPNPYGYQEFAPEASGGDESSEGMEEKPDAERATDETDTLAQADTTAPPESATVAMPESDTPESTEPEAEASSSSDGDEPEAESADASESDTTPPADDASGADADPVADAKSDSSTGPVGGAAPVTEDLDKSYAQRQTKRLILAFAAVAACLVVVTMVVMLRRG